MGKKLSVFVVLEIIALCLSGVIYLSININDSIRNKQKNHFERRNSTIFLNGTISEIQYDFDVDMWLTINERKYNLGYIYRVNNYIEDATVTGLLIDFYYLLEVGNIITIYESARTLVNNETIVIKPNYMDLRGFELQLSGAIMSILVVSIVLLIVFFCLSIVFIDDIPDTKKLQRWIDELKEETKKVKRENKELKKRVEKTEIELLKYNKGNELNLVTPLIRYCHECGSKVKGSHCNFCGAEVR